MEKILRIEETNFKKTADDWCAYEGWQIVTSEQTIKIGISDGQSCRESFGCIITNDETSEFVGAELKAIALVDEALNRKEIEELEYLAAGGVMFVNIETSEGLLQFAAYNAHNGYYGHEAVLISKQLNEEQSL